jgi:hypothetical protein
LTEPNSSLLAYPQFPDPLTEKVIRELFTPTPDELRWVWHTSSVPEARLGLLCLLKSFPLLGRFSVPASIPEFAPASTQNRSIRGRARRPATAERKGAQSYHL